MSDIRIEALEERVVELETENKKLNIILYHRENGLSHPDLQGEIDKSKFAELEAEVVKQKDEELRLLRRIEQLIIEKHKLRTALGNFGIHSSNCNVTLNGTLSVCDGICNCGFYEALNK